MKELITVENTGKKMSSLDIAEMMEKSHRHVIRDIKALVDQGAIGESNFGLSSYTTEQNKQAPMYLLDFDATMILITGYDANRRAIVIRRWRELETGAAQPAYQIKRDTPNTLLPVDKELRAAIRMAKAIGLKGNQAVLSANALARKITGTDCLQLLDATHLIAEDQERLLTPTEIGRLANIGSAQKVNKRLNAIGLQLKDGKAWAPTSSGQKFAVLMDTGKRHTNGSMVQQIKWKESVLKILVQEVAA